MVIANDLATVRFAARFERMAASAAVPFHSGRGIEEDPDAWVSRSYYADFCPVSALFVHT